MILCITFIVILVTLVFQGLTLPLIIRLLRLKVDEKEEEQQLSIRMRLASTALQHITTSYAAEVDSIDAFAQLKHRYERIVEFSGKKLGKEGEDDETTTYLSRYRRLLLEVIEQQREELGRMRHSNEYSDEILRRQELELDLEEARMRR